MSVSAKKNNIQHTSMRETAQPHLNGTYYGPSIPPPSNNYRRRDGGGGCCCCSCIMNCLCACICQILFTILIVVGIIVLIMWLICRPHVVTFHAAEARLTEFNINNSLLHYNLAVNLTIRNPNKRIGIYYDQIEARAFYQGQRFSTVQLGNFYQGKKNTSSLTAEFEGQQVVLLRDSEMKKYNENQAAGVYDIDIKLYLMIRLKFLFVKSAKMKPKIECELEIPLNSNGTASAVYEPKRCHFDWR